MTATDAMDWDCNDTELIGVLNTILVVDEGITISTQAAERARKRMKRGWEFPCERERLVHGHPIRERFPPKRQRIMRGRFSM